MMQEWLEEIAFIFLLGPLVSAIFYGLARFFFPNPYRDLYFSGQASMSSREMEKVNSYSSLAFSVLWSILSFGVYTAGQMLAQPWSLPEKAELYLYSEPSLWLIPAFPLGLGLSFFLMITLIKNYGSVLVRVLKKS